MTAQNPDATAADGTPVDPPFSAAALLLKPGDVVGERYEIVRLIGEGGMGAVFEAKHKILGRAVAIKILKPEIARNPQFSARFLVEAKAAAELHHRNIVELTDYGVDGDRPYMVMELLRGESLSAMLKRSGTLPLGRVVALIDPVLRALAMAHDRGVVHRDVKPENIFLVAEDDGEVTPKIVDFGIAKRHDENVQLTSANMALGTPAYMAPEQIMSSRSVTGAADQYAVGVTMYEALAGRNPYDAETLNAFIVAKATQEPAPIEQFRPDLDPRFIAVLMKTLSRKPEDRYPSLAALREALAPFRTSGSLRPPPMTEPAPTRTATPARPVPATAEAANPLAATMTSQNLGTPPSIAVPVPMAPTPTPAPSRTGLWAGIAVVTVAVIAGVGFVLSNRASSDGHAVQQGPAQPQTPDAPRAPAQVTFTIDVIPPNAVIKLDGEVVGTGHAELVRDRDGRRHQLGFEAAGYSPATEVVVADNDLRVTRTLTAASAPTPPTTATPETQPTHGRGHRGSTTPPPQTVLPSVPTATPPVEHPPAPPAPAQPTQPTRPTRDPSHPQVDPTNPFEGT